MAASYPVIEDCKRLDICRNIRECPVYRKLDETIAERTGVQGEDATDGTKDRDVTLKVFRKAGSASKAVYLSGYKWKAGKKGCYVDVRMDGKFPELHEELVAIHQERRIKLATEEPAAQSQ